LDRAGSESQDLTKISKLILKENIEGEERTSTNKHTLRSFVELNSKFGMGDTMSTVRQPFKEPSFAFPDGNGIEAEECTCRCAHRDRGKSGKVRRTIDSFIFSKNTTRNCETVDFVAFKNRRKDIIEVLRFKNMRIDFEKIHLFDCKVEAVKALTTMMITSAEKSGLRCIGGNQRIRMKDRRSNGRWESETTARAIKSLDVNVGVGEITKTNMGLNGNELVRIARGSESSPLATTRNAARVQTIDYNTVITRNATNKGSTIAFLQNIIEGDVRKTKSVALT